MKILDIALKDLLRSFRNMFFLVFGLGMPLLIAGIFYFAYGGLGSDAGFDVPQTTVQVVNLDEPASEYGDFSAGGMLVKFLQMEELADLMQVTEAADPAAARTAVDHQEAGVAVIIPEGFSAAVFDPQGRAAVELYQDPTLTLGPGIVRGLVTQFVDTLAGSKIAAGVAYDLVSEQGVSVDAATLQSIAIQYGDWAASLSEGQGMGGATLLAIQSPLGQEEKANGAAGMIGMIMAAMMVFCAFFTGAASAMTILQEEENGTLPRLFTTPTTQAAVLGGKFIAVFALIVVQIIVLMTVSSLIFETDWGAPAPLLLAVLELVVVAAGFGIFIASLLKGTKQAGVVYGGVMTVLGMMGMSSVFTANVTHVSPLAETLPLLVPQGWAMRAFRLVMNGGGVSDLLWPVAVTLALGALFFVVGVLKFRKRFA